MKRIFLPLVCIIASSCATTYVPPSSGPTATITFPVIKKNYSPLGGASYFGSRFAVENDSGCGKFSKDIPPDEIGGNIATRVIPANKKIFVQVLSSSGQFSCSVEGVFIPVENEKYTIEDAAGLVGCGILILDSHSKPVKLERAKADNMTGLTVCPI